MGFNFIQYLCWPTDGSTVSRFKLLYDPRRHWDKQRACEMFKRLTIENEKNRLTLSCFVSPCTSAFIYGLYNIFLCSWLGMRYKIVNEIIVGPTNKSSSFNRLYCDQTCVLFKASRSSLSTFNIGTRYDVSIIWKCIGQQKVIVCIIGPLQ